jgi:hypothetical protein
MVPEILRNCFNLSSFDWAKLMVNFVKQGCNLADPVSVKDHFDLLLKAVYPIQHSTGGIPTPLAEFKTWCSGPLEGLNRDTSYPRKQLSYFASRFLFRKAVPVPTGPSPVDPYLQKLGAPSPTKLDPQFLNFASSAIKRLFPTGWDKKYMSSCDSTVVGSSASLNHPRSEGGARSAWTDASLGDAVYRRMAKGEIQIPPLDPLRKVTVVKDGIKLRMVTVASHIQWLLKPLHTIMYNHLTNKEPFLRGDAKPSSFKGFSSARGEYFVSGDYESATDNIPLELSEFLLSAILDQCEHVPVAIRQLAIASLRGVLSHDDKLVVQQSGQLMGNLLSFPLLCALNFLVFKFSIRRRVPVRINGDDIAFRATPQEIARWFNTVGRCGLVVSVGKTLVHKAFFSLNSTFFLAKECAQPACIPVIRSKCIYKPFDDPDPVGLRGRSRTVASKFWLEARRVIVHAILRIHAKVVSGASCSVNRGLGIKADGEMLSNVVTCHDLLSREYTFLQLPAELDKLKSELTGGLPPGWSVKKVGKRDAKYAAAYFGEDRVERYRKACYQQAWKKPEPRKVGGIDQPASNKPEKEIEPARLPVWHDFLGTPRMRRTLQNNGTSARSIVRKFVRHARNWVNRRGGVYWERVQREERGGYDGKWVVPDQQWEGWLRAKRTLDMKFVTAKGPSRD